MRKQTPVFNGHKPFRLGPQFDRSQRGTAADVPDHLFEVKSQNDMAWVTFNDTATVLWMNESAAFLFRARPGSLANVPFSKFVFAEDAELFMAHLRRCRLHPQNPNLTRLRLEVRGQMIPVDLLSFGTPLRNGYVYRSCLLYGTPNVSLFRPETIAQMVPEMLDNPIAAVNRRGSVVWSNRAFRRFFNVPEGACCITSLPGVGWSDAGFQEKLEATFSNRAKAQVLLTDCALRHRDGRVLTLSIIFRRLRLSTEEETLVLVQMQNITERLQAEASRDLLLEETERLSRELEGRVKERTEELTGTNARLQELSATLIQAQEAERRRIAMELHDEVGQGLTGLNLILAELSRSATPAQEKSLAEAKLALARVHGQIRTLSVGLRPQVLDDFGLVAALKWHFEQFKKHSGVRLSFSTNFPEQFHVEHGIALTLYRLTQEALNNVARHAAAKKVQVRLDHCKERYNLSIKDDGRGFSVDAQASVSTGLSGMRERVRLHGGEIQIDSAPQRGTLIRCWIPSGGGGMRRCT